MDLENHSVICNTAGPVLTSKILTLNTVKFLVKAYNFLD
jgi:hypothetical protein